MKNIKYQKCPKCDGQGTVSKPRYVAGNVHESLSSSVSHICDVCNGNKIIILQPMLKNDDDAFSSVITLRDYFANSVDGAKIAEGYNIETIKQLMNVSVIPTPGLDNIIFWFEVEAKLQYMKADAMLKQREL
jgi:hypothetical protein